METESDLHDAYFCWLHSSMPTRHCSFSSSKLPFFWKGVTCYQKIEESHEARCLKADEVMKETRTQKANKNNWEEKSEEIASHKKTE